LRGIDVWGSGPFSTNHIDGGGELFPALLFAADLPLGMVFSSQSL